MTFAQKIKKILNYDILAHMVAGYRAIPNLYKATFWTVFITLNIVFAYHTAHFIMGNHEWPFMRDPIAWNRFWYEGRITETIPYALFGFQLLPIALNLFDFMGIALSVVALAHFLKIPHSKFCFMGFCLPIAVLPYNLCWLFHNSQGVFYYGAFLSIMAFIWIEHLYQKHQLFLKYIFPIFILFFVLGFHAGFIETMSILILSHVLIRYLLGEKFKPLFKLTFILFINVGIAAIFLRVGLDILDNMGYLYSNFYNIQTVKLTDLYTHFVEVCGYVIKQFTLTYPFLDRSYLSFLWGICIFSGLMALCQACRKHSFRGFLTLLSGLVGILFLTQFATLISDNTNNLQFMIRLNGFFGIQYMFVFFWAFLFQICKPIFFRNLLFIGTIALSAFGIQRDMYAMRVWKQALDTEDKMMSRVIARIENTPNFSYNKKYRMVQIGDFSFRERFYKGEFNENDATLLGWSYRANWLNHLFYNFNAPENFMIQDLENHNNVDLRWKVLFEHCTPKDFDFIMNKAKVWPDQNSIYVSKNLILIFIDKWELQNLRNKLKDYLEKNNIQIQSETQSIPFNEQLKHPDWGPDTLIRMDDERVYHPRFNNYATLIEYTNDHILLDWDCCGRELFIKNGDGIYEYRK